MSFQVRRRPCYRDAGDDCSRVAEDFIRSFLRPRLPSSRRFSASVPRLDADVDDNVRVLKDIAFVCHARPAAGTVLKPYIVADHGHLNALRIGYLKPVEFRLKETVGPLIVLLCKPLDDGGAVKSRGAPGLVEPAIHRGAAIVLRSVTVLCGALFQRGDVDAISECRARD